MSSIHAFDAKLDLVLDEIRVMLLEKNRKYGNSALEPIRVFSKAEPLAQIEVRMDDKLSRIKSAQGDDLEDARLDLLGYLILERVSKLWKTPKSTETETLEEGHTQPSIKNNDNQKEI